MEGGGWWKNWGMSFLRGSFASQPGGTWSLFWAELSVCRTRNTVVIGATAWMTATQTLGNLPAPSFPQLLSKNSCMCYYVCYVQWTCCSGPLADAMKGDNPRQIEQDTTSNTGYLESRMCLYTVYVSCALPLRESGWNKLTTHAPRLVQTCANP